MQKPIVKPKMFQPKDVYQSYVKILLAENPEFWGVYSRGRKMKNFWIYRRVKGKVVEVLNFDRWYHIMVSFIMRIRDRVTAGEVFEMGHNLGKIEARCIERNFSNPKVNFFETNKQPKKMNDKGKMVPERIVFFTDEEYVRIGWDKSHNLTNETVYEFRPTQGNVTKEGFAEAFSHANMKNPLLKRKYRYFAYVK
jgi:hypothetical protein